MKFSKFAKPSKQKTCFVPGDWNVLDDVTGFKVKASQTRKQWDGMRSAKALPRHEQDFLRSRKERIRIPWNRSEPADSFGQTSASDL